MLRLHVNKFVPLFLLVTLGCREASEPAPSSKEAPTDAGSAKASVGESSEEILVTSEFLRDVGQLLLKGKLSVRKIVPDDLVSPDWRPRRAEIGQLRSAKLIVLNGSGFEPWKDRVSLPGSRVVDTSNGYKDQLIRIPDAVTHRHGPDGAHSHAGTIWATWLDPDLAAAQLTEVEKALSKVAPNQKLEIARAAGPIKSQLKSLSDELEALKVTAAARQMEIVSDGPAVMYLTRRLGLELKYLHWQNPSDLSKEDEAELQALTTNHSGENSHRIFMLNTRYSQSAEELCRVAGFEVIRIDTLETAISQSSSGAREDALNSISRMKSNIERLKATLTAVNRPSR